MRTRSLFVALAIFVAAYAAAQEKITLATPESKTNTGWDTARIILDQELGRIEIQLKGDNNEPNRCVYTATTTPTGAFLLTQLNKANLSSAYAGNATTGSLKQRIQHRLNIGPGTMGESAQVCEKPITGTLTGSVP